MLKYLMLFTFMTAALSAEKIGNVEFQLPNAWTVEGQPQKNDKSTTITYVHPNHDSQYFMAHVNNMATGPMDDQTLQQVMQSNNPGKKVSINVLDRTPDSVLFEWAIKNDSGTEVEHGWSRFIKSGSDNVVLMFRTKDVNYVDQLRPIWVKTLKSAKDQNSK